MEKPAEERNKNFDLDVEHDDDFEMGDCPVCSASWKIKQGSGWYSRLIGIEDPKVYDGVYLWQCPDCQSTWDRWSGEIECDYWDGLL